jgi:uncharacterized membrane protein
MTQSRWKSPVLWTATIANIAIIVGIFLPAFDAAPYVKAIGIIITMLVQFGVMNNPTNKSGV